MLPLGKRSLILLAAFVLACQSDDPAGGSDLNGIVIDSVNPLATIGRSVVVTVKALDIAGDTGAAVSNPVLESSDPSILTVTGTTITAQRNGAVTLTATYQGFQTGRSVTVQQEPSTIEKIAGDSQVGPVASLVTTLPMVRVVDSGGTPIPGALVVFDGEDDGTGQAGDAIGETLQIADSLGFATAEGWRLGSVARANLLTAQSQSASVTFTALGLPRSPARIGLFPELPTGGPAGLPIPPLVAQIQDMFGNVVVTATDTVTIALGANPTGASLGGTTKIAPVNGVAIFSDLTIGVPALDYSLVATAPGLTPDTTIVNIIP